MPQINDSVPIDVYLTTADVSLTLRVHPNTVRRWIKTGELRAIKFGHGRTLRVPRAELERFETTRMTTA